MSHYIRTGHYRVGLNVKRQLIRIRINRHSSRHHRRRHRHHHRNKNKPPTFVLDKTTGMRIEEEVTLNKSILCYHAFIYDQFLALCINNFFKLFLNNYFNNFKSVFVNPSLLRASDLLITRVLLAILLMLKSRLSSWYQNVSTL